MIFEFEEMYALRLNVTLGHYVELLDTLGFAPIQTGSQPDISGRHLLCPSPQPVFLVGKTSQGTIRAQ